MSSENVHGHLQKTLRKELFLGNMPTRLQAKHNLNRAPGEMAAGKMNHPQKKYKCLDQKISTYRVK